MVDRNGLKVLVVLTTQYSGPDFNGGQGSISYEEKHYWDSVAASARHLNGRKFSATAADGTRSIYFYQFGNYSNGSFVPDLNGYFWREISYTGHSQQQTGSVLLNTSSEPEDFSSISEHDPLYLIPHRSNKTVVIKDSGGNNIHQSHQVWGEQNGNSLWITREEVSHSFSIVGNLLQSHFSNGDTYQAWYGVDGRLSEELRPDGSRFEYLYDSLGRLEVSIQTNVPVPGGEIATTFSYNALGMVIEQSRNAGPADSYLL
ncbi:MAG: hypothetical protein LR015_01035 [Verrucomicrobia bacterium]|nr:hypothetical protein [Verrucomicrobiota bacterium]